MSHAAYEEALAVYLHLPPAQRGEVDAHLSSCPACAARLAEYQALQRALAARPAPKPSGRLRASFAAAVARVREEDLHPRPWARLVRATLALGNAAAWAGVAVVTLLLLAGLAISGPQLARRAWPVAQPTNTATGATPATPAEPAVTVARLERVQDLCCPPTFAPDGQTYLTIQDGRVWLHSLAGGAARELPLVVEPPAGAAPVISNATWTPDGAAIVASQATEGKPSPLYLVDPKSGAARLLGETYMPWRLRFDARGRLVVATERAFQTLDLASGDLADLPGVGAWFVGGADTELAFSPDGRYLAALEGQELAVVDLATAARTLITTRIHPRWRAAFAWSPDGRQLAYATGERGGMPELWVAGPDGRDARRLATRESERDIGGAYVGLAWLPGTSIILYQFLPSGNAATLQAEYQAISAAGGPAKTLFRNGIGLNLSPDGRLISFTRDIEGAEETGNWVAVLEHGDAATPTPTPVGAVREPPPTPTPAAAPEPPPTGAPSPARLALASVPNPFERRQLAAGTPIAEAGLYFMDVATGAIEAWSLPGAKSAWYSTSPDNRWLIGYSPDAACAADRRSGAAYRWGRNTPRLLAAQGDYLLFLDGAGYAWIAGPGQPEPVPLTIGSASSQAVISPDGRAAAVTSGSTLYLVQLDRATWRAIGEMKDPAGRPAQSTFLQTGRRGQVIAVHSYWQESIGAVQQMVQGVEFYSWQGERLGKLMNLNNLVP